MIYLDNNATTRPAPEVVAAVTAALETGWANPSSQHNVGQAAARAVAGAREHLSALLGVPSAHIVFTSGATEANEAVLRRHLQDRRPLVTSEAEHPAVNGLYRRDAPDLVRIVPIDDAGRWDFEVLERHLAEGPALVAVAWASGETGVIQDVHRIRRAAHAREGTVLVDASQAVGRIPIDAQGLGADHLTLSGHKFHAPKGVGALVSLGKAASGVTAQVGGEQENGRRGGTENVPGIAGLGAACRLRRDGLDGAMARLEALRHRFEEVLSADVPDILINGAGAPRVPNTSNVTFRGVDGMALVARLDGRGIVCSQVSACSSASPEPSRTLTAMGRTADEAFSSVRFAVAVDNTLPEIESAAQAVAEEAALLREMMGGLV